jgi:hypothetical protein
MQRWFYMLGGLLVWAFHFVGVYAIASIGDVVARADDPAWRMIGLGFSALCALIVAGLLIQALRRKDDGTDTIDFGNLIARVGAGLALVSIVWQTLPTVIGY